MPLFLASVSEVLLWTLVPVIGAGAVCVAYGVFVERRWYRTAEYRLPSLPEGASSLSILHLSDLHFVRRDRGKAAFLRSLPRPDVVVITGDLLGEPLAVRAVADALRPVRGRLASYFVLGSNDYYAPKPLNYAAYFRWRQRRNKGVWGRSEDLIARLRQDGWELLRNRKASFSGDGARFEVTGLDDPHLQRHDFRVAPRTDPQAFGMAVVHSPDLAPELAALGYDLIVAGHTHGGQVRMPFVGALITNGTTPAKLARGLSRLGRTYMHVSPGLGTSKYAPFRFLCRPEATILELVPRSYRAETASSYARS
jgi:predicted MPP superfamily phosphohydrolase